MGKSLKHKMKCGCEIWDGNDYQGIGYLHIELCHYHKYVCHYQPEEVNKEMQPDAICNHRFWDKSNEGFWVCNKCGGIVRR